MPGLIDSTLREGGQMVGVNFRLDEKMALIRALDRFGIEEIEVGVASAYDPDLPELFRGCRREGIRARLALWGRCRTEDLELAATLRPDVLSLSIPGSDLHIAKKLGQDRAWVLNRVGESLRRARRLGIGYLSLGIEDATRSAPDFLAEIVATATAAGVDRIRLADTVGIATPGSLARLLEGLRQTTGLPLGVHCHNDFGMASANTIAALESSAAWGDVTVYGIGERAGNARLEEVAGFLALRQGHPYDLEGLRELVELVAGCCGKELDPHHPVVGEKIFQCETGLHLQGLAIDTATYEPYPPESVGAERKLLYGAKIGAKEWRRLTAGLALNLSPAALTGLVGDFRRYMASRRTPMEEHELQELFASLG